MVYFDYQKSRSRAGPESFLGKFQRAIQTDVYQAYDIFDKNPGVTLLVCMAHARRYFEQALDNDAEKADYVLTKIQILYAIERRAREMEYSQEQRYYYRKRMAKPVLKKLEKWLKTNIHKVYPKSAIGEAIAYTLNLWPRLKCYKDNGKWEIDNIL